MTIVWLQLSPSPRISPRHDYIPPILNILVDVHIFFHKSIPGSALCFVNNRSNPGFILIKSLVRKLQPNDAIRSTRFPCYIQFNLDVPRPNDDSQAILSLVQPLFFNPAGSLSLNPWLQPPFFKVGIVS